jgi:hypothetical protein
MHDCVWSIGGMKLTKDKWSAWKETCPIDTLSTTNPTLTGMGSNLVILGERPATVKPSHGTALIVLYNPEFYHVTEHAMYIKCMSS